MDISVKEFKQLKEQCTALENELNEYGQCVLDCYARVQKFATSLSGKELRSSGDVDLVAHCDTLNASILANSGHCSCESYGSIIQALFMFEELGPRFRAIDGLLKGYQAKSGELLGQIECGTSTLRWIVTSSGKKQMAESAYEQLRTELAHLQSETGSDLLRLRELKDGSLDQDDAFLKEKEYRLLQYKYYSLLSSLNTSGRLADEKHREFVNTYDQLKRKFGIGKSGEKLVHSSFFEDLPEEDKEFWVSFAKLPMDEMDQLDELIWKYSVYESARDISRNARNAANRCRTRLNKINTAFGTCTSVHQAIKERDPAFFGLQGMLQESLNSESILAQDLIDAAEKLTSTEVKKSFAYEREAFLLHLRYASFMYALSSKKKEYEKAVSENESKRESENDHLRLLYRGTAFCYRDKSPIDWNEGYLFESGQCTAMDAWIRRTYTDEYIQNCLTKIDGLKKQAEDLFVDFESKYKNVGVVHEAVIQQDETLVNICDEVNSNFIEIVQRVSKFEEIIENTKEPDYATVPGFQVEKKAIDARVRLFEMMHVLTTIRDMERTAYRVCIKKQNELCGGCDKDTRSKGDRIPEYEEVVKTVLGPLGGDELARLSRNSLFDELIASLIRYKQVRICSIKADEILCVVQDAQLEFTNKYFTMGAVHDAARMETTMLESDSETLAVSYASHRDDVLRLVEEANAAQCMEVEDNADFKVKKDLLILNLKSRRYEETFSECAEMEKHTFQELKENCESWKERQLGILAEIKSKKPRLTLNYPVIENEKEFLARRKSFRTLKKQFPAYCGQFGSRAKANDSVCVRDEELLNSLMRNAYLYKRYHALRVQADELRTGKLDKVNQRLQSLDMESEELQTELTAIGKTLRVIDETGSSILDEFANLFEMNETAFRAACSANRHELFELIRSVDDSLVAPSYFEIDVYGLPMYRKMYESYKTRYERAQEVVNAAVDQIRGNISSVRTELVQEELGEMPIEDLAKAKAGIRTATLRAHGYTNLGMLVGESVESLLDLSGIGEDSAQKIIYFVKKTADELMPTVKIHLSQDNRTPCTTALLKSITAYDVIGTFVDAYNKASVRFEEMTDCMKDLEVLRNDECWPLRSCIDGVLLAYSYAHLRECLDDPGKFQEFETFSNITTAQCKPKKNVWKEFEKNPIHFVNVLERVEPGLFSNGDKYYGLPEDLGKEIAEQKLILDGLRCELRPYQELGVKYILHQKKVLLGDEMGLGKTVEAIATMVSLANAGGRYFMVICPASVITNWCREIDTKSKLRPVEIHGADKQSRFNDWTERGGVAVTNFESLRNLNVPRDFKYSMLVVDEAHYIKNRETARAVNTLEFAKQTERLLFMSGTPIENRVEEMISLIEYLNPDMAREIDMGSLVMNSENFRNKIAPVYYRRKREDVINDLPELTEMYEWCRISQGERDAYENAILKRKYSDARRVGFNAPTLSASCKAQRLLEIVQEAETNERKIIVFSFFLKTIAAVQDLLGDKRCFVLNGSVSANKRQQIIDDFTNSGSGNVLVAQINSGGTGLNIQTASVVVICEPQLNPSIENQAISRAYRMGQKRNVLVYRLLCEDTIEDAITEKLEEKQKIFNEYADKSAAATQLPNLEIDDKAYRDILEEEYRRIRNKSDNVEKNSTNHSESILTQVEASAVDSPRGIQDIQIFDNAAVGRMKATHSTAEGSFNVQWTPESAVVGEHMNSAVNSCLVEPYKVEGTKITNSINGNNVTDTRVRFLGLEYYKDYKALEVRGIVYLSQLLKTSVRELQDLKTSEKTIRAVLEYLPKYLKDHEINADSAASGSECLKNSDYPAFLQDFSLSGERIIANGNTGYVENAMIEDLKLERSKEKQLRLMGLGSVCDLLRFCYEDCKYGMFTQMDLYPVFDAYLRQNIISNEEENARSLEMKILSLYRANEFKTITFQEMLHIDENCAADTLTHTLDAMKQFGKIDDCGNDKYCLHHDSFFEQVEQHLNSSDIVTKRRAMMLNARFEGLTLQEAAAAFGEGVTRERVRQICKKLMDQITNDGRKVFAEDRYAAFYQKYDCPQELLVDHLGVSVREFNYLRERYEHGSADIETAGEDTSLTLADRKSIEEYQKRKMVLIDGEYVKNSRTELNRFVVEHYCKNEVEFGEYLNLYCEILRKNNILNNNEMDLEYNNERGMVNSIATADYVLWKQNQRFRYYDIEGHDYTELLDTLDLENYKDTGVSTLKWMIDYPDLMKQYDIRDEYELHNLLKKIHAERRNASMTFGRMPSVVFGTFDRAQAFMELMIKYAPISAHDLAVKVNETYGYSVATTLANMPKELSEYLSNGVYSVSSATMSQEHLEALDKALDQEFYYLSEITEKYMQLFPDVDETEISEHNLKKIGFDVYSNYAIRGYDSANAYFNHILLEEDMSDIHKFDRYLPITLFYQTMAEGKRNLEIIEFEPNQFINIRRLERLGIDKGQLSSFLDHVSTFTESIEYFTLPSIKKHGFEDPLFDLGFEDLFYESLLKSRFSNTSVFMRPVFARTQSSVSKSTFFAALIMEQNSVELDDFTDQLVDTYGIETTAEKIVSSMRNCDDVYYDGIMRTFYSSYEEYLKEIEE